MNTETKTKPISSFAAPSEVDLRAFEAMSTDEQKDAVLAEIDKGFEGAPEPLTAETSRDILKSALDRLPGHAQD